MIAVLGTGIMGSAMARNLIAAGLETTVWDRSAAATGPLAAAGARVAASPADALPGADVVITMLPTAEIVRSVLFDGGAAQAFAVNAVWAQMGTIGVAATLQMAGQLRELKARRAAGGRARIGQQGSRRGRAAADPGVRA
jgi:3-hydroxyisobutyrate dehydrogenase